MYRASCTVHYTDQQSKHLPSTIITRITLDSSQRFFSECIFYHQL